MENWKEFCDNSLGKVRVAGMAQILKIFISSKIVKNNRINKLASQNMILRQKLDIYIFILRFLLFSKLRLKDVIYLAAERNCK